ncbi:AbrB/MazE/SpoVT family DNA-binding domain-containing protein [Candidatus Woesearchaeota archaeon]|nr:AbrB/MazE/SpoVT family DNA-binding domain-containing protein [Candidatus Woesearchaeota archaeon]
MKRRVIKQGNNTLTITLPRKWAQKFEINAGDELDVEEDERNLVISTEKETRKKSIKVDLKDFKRLGRSYLTAIFRNDYDEIELIYNDPGYLAELQNDLASQLIGFEITNVGKNFCQIKDVAGINKDEFDTLLRRTWLLLINLSEDTLEALSKKDYSVLKTMPERDRSINKFTNYCARLLNKKQHYKSKNLSYYNFLRNLEHIGDDYQHLAKECVENNLGINKNLSDYFKKMNNFLREAYEMFYSFEKEKMEKLFHQLTSANKELKKISANNNVVIVNYLFSLRWRIRNLLSTIIEINLN